MFRSKLTFRPHSTDSQTHRKMTLSIADRFSKAQKIRVLPAVGKDPESQRLERIKVNKNIRNFVAVVVVFVFDVVLRSVIACRVMCSDPHVRCCMSELLPFESNNNVIIPEP